MDRGHGPWVDSFSGRRRRSRAVLLHELPGEGGVAVGDATGGGAGEMRDEECCLMIGGDMQRPGARFQRLFDDGIEDRDQIGAETCSG